MNNEKTKQIDEQESQTNTPEEQLNENQLNGAEEDVKTEITESVDQQETEVQAKDKAIEQLREELESTQDSLLRKAAELENIRKRVQRERSQIYESAKIKAVEKFLPINDDLQRTTEAVKNADVDDHFKDGVSMIADKFLDTLKDLGVEPINETGVPFNVDLHDALFRQKADDDSVQSDTVLQIVENGYRLGDRTIRHAKVIVSE